MIYAPGAASQSLDVQIVDDTGLPVTGLVAATFPALTYSLAGPNADVAFPALSDLAAITTAYASGGVKERGNGVYRLDVPNGAFTTAGIVKVRGEATNKRVLAPWVEVGYVQSDVRQLLGTAWLTPAVAGTPDVNAKQLGGTPQTARDIGASVLLAANQHVIVDSGTITTYTGNTPQTGDAFVRIGAAGAGLTALGDARLANLDAAVSSRSVYAGGAVASVTGNVGGTVGGLAAAAKTDVAHAVWDAASLSYTVAGSMGEVMFVTIPNTSSNVVNVYNSLVAKTGTVTDASATTTVFKTALTQVTGFWDDCLVTFTSGSLLGQTKPIRTFVQGGGFGTFTMDEAFTSAPADLTDFIIIRTHVHPVTQIADGILDRANAIETGLTPRQAMRLGAAADAGKLSGAATTTVVIRNAVADSKARITATVDVDGNRSAVTTDVT